jgi:hypothetical protein
MTKSKKKSATKHSPLQAAGAKFVDALGSRAIDALKSKLGLNTELHCVDVSAGSATLGTTLAQIQGAITIAQGTSNTTRVGDSVRVVSYEQRLAAWSQATTAGSCLVRFIGVANRNNAPATSPSVGIILQDPTDPLSPYDASFAQSGLEIIFDKTITVSGQVKNTDKNAIVASRQIWHPQDYHITFTQADTTGVQADLVAGGMYVYAMYGLPSQAMVAAPKYNITSRVTFVDN